MLWSIFAFVYICSAADVLTFEHSGRRENDVYNAVIVAYDRCRRQLTSGGWAWACECPKNGDDCVCIDCLKNTENDWRNIEPEVDGNEDAGRRKPQQQDGSQKSEEAGCQQRRIRTYLSRILPISGSRGGDRRTNRDGVVTRILKALRRRPEERRKDRDEAKDPADMQKTGGAVRIGWEKGNLYGTESLGTLQELSVTASHDTEFFGSINDWTALDGDPDFRNLHDSPLIPPS